MEEHIDMMDNRSGEMRPYSPAKAERGKKWKRVLEFAKFKEDIKTIEWLDSQKAIVEDIAYYEKSLEPVPKETKVKKPGK